MVSGVEELLMHEVLLQNYCPAFGFLPDLAMLVLHPPFGETASPPNHHWTLEPPPAAVDAAHEPNFVFDILQRIQAQINRPVVVSHDFTHECVDITADFGIGGHYVTRLLDRAATFRGYPQSVRTDNGPEFTCRAFMTWAQKHSIQHILIEPGSPTQNAYIESFNGTFRDECLDESWFESLEQARQTIATWRVDYNETRPHSSCGRMPPATFAALNRQLTGDSMQQHDCQMNQLILQTLDFWNLDWYGDWGQVKVQKANG